MLNVHTGGEKSWKSNFQGDWSVYLNCDVNKYKTIPWEWNIILHPLLPPPPKRTGESRHIDPFAKFVLSSYTGMHRINIHIHEVSKKLKKEFKNKRYFSAHKKRHLMKMIVVTAVHSHLIWEILNLTFDNLWYWSICLLVSTNENR